MHDVFYWILNMSISGTIAGILVLLLRRIKKIPRRVIYVLWAIPLIRLVIPFSLSFEFSVAQLIKDATRRVVTVYPRESFLNSIECSSMNYIAAAKDYFPIEYKTNYLKILFESASVVWIIVCAALIVLTLFFYARALRSVRGAAHLRDNIYVSDDVESPTVFGVFRQKIVFPVDADAENELVLLHEKVHVRRVDNLCRFGAVLVCCVHWFNPFLWLMLKYFFSDLEMSADECVIDSLDGDMASEYAAELVDYARSRMILSSSVGGAGLRGRVENILTYRKMTVFSAVSAALFVLAIAIVILTNSI